MTTQEKKQEKKPLRRKRPSRAKSKPQVIEHWHQGGSMCCPHPDCMRYWQGRIDAGSVEKVVKFRDTLTAIIGLVDNQRFRYEASGADGLRELLSEIQDVARKAID